MGIVIIEVDEDINLKIKAKTLEEAINNIKKTIKKKEFKALRLKTKDFKFDREEANAR
ncbi:hypothetical protein [Persephonella sp. IF05-L8]|uniref:hypothetical protein n=1 Tax=Persephonella sp. IF05-L8 TaxID=1158338 RepID=UPI0012DF9A6B